MPIQKQQSSREQSSTRRSPTRACEPSRNLRIRDVRGAGIVVELVDAGIHQAGQDGRGDHDGQERARRERQVEVQGKVLGAEDQRDADDQHGQRDQANQVEDERHDRHAQRRHVHIDQRRVGVPVSGRRACEFHERRQVEGAPDATVQTRGPVVGVPERQGRDARRVDVHVQRVVDVRGAAGLQFVERQRDGEGPQAARQDAVLVVVLVAQREELRARQIHHHDQDQCRRTAAPCHEGQPAGHVVCSGVWCRSFWWE